MPFTFDIGLPNCGAKALFEAVTGRFFQGIGRNTVLCRSAYAFGYSLVELFKRAQFRIDVGLSPTFEELNRSFGHGYSPGARLSYRRPLLSGRSDGGLLRQQLVVSHYVITLIGACHEESASWVRQR